MKRIMILVALGIAMIGAVVAVVWLPQMIHNWQHSPVVAQIQQAGVLRVGIDPTYPPMESLDESGEMVGFDIDVASKIAQKFGVRLEKVHVVWDDFFPAVNRGEVDMLISSITITPDRREQVTFSRPYFSSGQVLVVRADDPTITQPGDLQGRRVRAQEGTTSLEEAYNYTSETLVSTYASTYDESLQHLRDGMIDALIIDLPAGSAIVQSTPGLRIAGEPFTSEFYGIAVARDNTELAAEIDHILEQLQESGELESIKSTWFKNVQ